ncbi:hypothetical protein GCM10008107_20700 [Psychrosphaera saromensis]|uniref:Uncharacterized protein n=1 Tax=Psychrosphaera saromensis TaxID=716813 RepID=A0A2S7URZ5_9GAMM|nr:hypothetical protein [Psychrosphaera saromensis]PQJ52764.1 hypothetical protein BTO11_03230 [Psychrosphaera saromensis]GHB71052.1 hypothetical protein GCM10008107_20700 [Psychrosphaera saromensis]GLQ13256.1 hypothetical protein GCM10007917_07110 [Psychrosphaera saromensis]
MPQYIVNKNPDNKGLHEVHALNSCVSHNYPNTSNQVDLGFHINCYLAIAYAKVLYPSSKFDGCFYCANDCHTG